MSVNKARVQNILQQLSAGCASVQNEAAANNRLPFTEGLFRLDKRVAIVTGGSVGIGFEIASAFSSVGAHVLITARTKDQVLKAAKTISQKTGNPVIGMRSDVSKSGDCKEAVERCIYEFGKLDILVNNAGIGHAPITIEDFPEKDIRQVLDINLMGVVIMCKEALPYLRKQKAARIINIGSILGVVGMFGGGPYAISKHALPGLTETLAIECADSSVRINNIAPGWTNTQMVVDHLEVGGVESLKVIIDRIPIKKIANVREVAGIAVYLAGDLSSYVTGATIAVDGGWLS